MEILRVLIHLKVFNKVVRISNDVPADVEKIHFYSTTMFQRSRKHREASLNTMLYSSKRPTDDAFIFVEQYVIVFVFPITVWMD